MNVNFSLYEWIVLYTIVMDGGECFTLNSTINVQQNKKNVTGWYDSMLKIYELFKVRINVGFNNLFLVLIAHLCAMLPN